MSVGFSVDLAEGVEPVIHLKPVEFIGKIIIQKSKVAIKKVKKDMSDLIFWSDRSKKEVGGAGAAVAINI